MRLQKRRIGKNELWWVSKGRGEHGEEPVSVDAVHKSISGKFRFVEETEETPGLRTPQLGALHAILAVQSVGFEEPATVVLPTGTGKTETMLSVYCWDPRLTVVIVPSDSLRTQIGEKFATLGILPSVGAVEGDYFGPRVGIIRSRFETSEQVLEVVEQSNIIVSTAAALGRSSSEALGTLAKRAEQLFVDEAHHVPARTWSRIVSFFDERPILQFTATPFREDGRIIEGRIVYAYPLRLAQENGWFAKINYRAVTSALDVDREIATAAVNQLREDLDMGRNHILMARVQTIPRAEQIVDLYKELAPDLNPVRIDSKLSLIKQRKAKRKLNERTSRIVVCVDMFGEGFDLPALKVAAIHDPHKSLAVTLQFIGRFARVGGIELGEASVFVPRQTGLVDNRLRRLYAEDADWNAVVRDLTHAAVGYEVERTEFEAEFNQLPTEMSIRGIQPRMSTVIYRSPTPRWNPNGVYQVFDEATLLTKKIAINERARVVWFVTAEQVPVRWTDFSRFTEIVHHLYVIHVDEQAGLLFINSSNNDSLHSELACAIGGADVRLIKGDVVYRVLARIARRIPTNVGLLDAVNRNRRFSMHVGADVLEGFGPGAAQKAKTNIFAHGYAEGTRVSFGASRKGRIWSHRVAKNILDWVQWTEGVGTAVTDDSIELEEVMRGFIIPKEATSRPELVPLAVEWPHEIGFTSSDVRQISYRGSTHPLIDVALVPRTFNREDPIEFDVKSDNWTLRYAFVFGEEGPTVHPVGDDATAILPNGESIHLSRFMSDMGLSVYFEKEALLSPDGYLLHPDRQRPRFPKERLESIDWSGIDIRKESQGPRRDADSVQYRVAEILSEEEEWEIVLDDDGTGEIADLLFLRRAGAELEVLLVHCKYSSSERPGARVGDLYEVCGQAAKCYNAKSDIGLLLLNAIRREKRRQQQARSGLLTGTIDTLYSLLNDSWRLLPNVTVLVAQPGLSRARMSMQQSELLGCVDLYLSETYASSFRVLCSD